MSIDVQVTGGGTIASGEMRVDASVVARCTICAAEVDATARIGDASACAPCLRARLDALSIARFRLSGSSSTSIPWGKVSG